MIAGATLYAALLALAVVTMIPAGDAVLSHSSSPEPRAQPA